MKKLLIIAALAAACTKSPEPAKPPPQLEVDYSSPSVTEPTPFRPVPSKQTRVVWDDKQAKYVPEVEVLPQVDDKTASAMRRDSLIPAQISKPRQQGETFFLTLSASSKGTALVREVQVSEADWLKYALRKTACVEVGFLDGSSGKVLDCQ